MYLTLGLTLFILIAKKHHEIFKTNLLYFYICSSKETHQMKIVTINYY